MGSVKLSSIMSVANSFLGGSKGTSKVPKQAAVDLLKKSPLEMKASDGQAHLVGNPLAFTSLQYPRNLGVDGGHFIIFYSISNNKSLDKDTEFNKKIGVSIDSEDVTTYAGDMDYTGTKSKKYSKIKKLKQSRNGGDIQIGKPAPNSVLTGGLSTHTTVTGGVSLYMPPGIKASYSADTGHSELGKAGMLAGSISRMMASKSSIKRFRWFCINSC